VKVPYLRYIQKKIPLDLNLDPIHVIVNLNQDPALSQEPQDLVQDLKSQYQDLILDQNLARVLSHDRDRDQDRDRDRDREQDRDRDRDRDRNHILNLLQDQGLDPDTRILNHDPDLNQDLDQIRVPKNPEVAAEIQKV